MVTYDDFVQNCYDLGDDNTAAMQVFFPRFGKHAYRRAMRLFGRQFEERTKTTSTVALQQYYQLPVDYSFMKTVKVAVGTLSYPMDEVKGQKEWDQLNRLSNVSSDRPTKFFVRLNLGQGGDEVGFWPMPSSSGNQVTLVYNAVPRDIGQLAFMTGTVTVTTQTRTVTGSVAAFTPQMVGRFLKVSDPQGDGNFYKVSAYVSSSSLTLQNYYEGPTASVSAYGIYDLFALPEEAQMVPVYYAMWHYYLMRQNRESASLYKALYEDEFTQARQNHEAKTLDSVVSRRRDSNLVVDYPLWFPSSGITPGP